MGEKSTFFAFYLLIYQSFCYSEVENVLVGMSKRLFTHLDKQNARLKKKKADKKAQKKAPTEEPVEEASKPNKKKKLKDSKKKQIVVASEDESLEFDTEETESAEEREVDDEDNNVVIEESDVEIEENDFKDEETESEETRSESDPEDAESTEAELVEVPAKKNNKELSPETSNNTPILKLSGVSSFFNTEVKEESDSSSDDEETVCMYLIYILSSLHVLIFRMCC